MAKYKLQINTDTLSLYQLKKLIVFLFGILAKKKVLEAVDSADGTIPDEIKQHFQKI